MHLFKLRLKSLLRDKTLIFWTLLFPIALSTLFNLAFAQITNLDSFESINVCIIESDNVTDEFINIIDSVEFKEGKKMFNVGVKSKEDAKVLLDKNQIVGYLEFDETGAILMTIKNSGINETILKSFLDDYVQTSATITSIVYKSGGAVDINTLLSQISNHKNYISENNETNNPNLILIYFYSLLAMTLVYGGIFGTNEITNLQANLSNKGLRVSVGPTKRLKLLLINMSCAFIIHISEIIIFLLYITFALGITLGNNLPLILLLCVLGSLTGISFGAFIAISLRKASMDVKIVITSMVGVLGGFFSGMMYANVKYWIQTNIPILGYINPVNVITDGLFSLYYFNTLDRYILNMIILLVMCLVFVTGTYLIFRRDNYESV